MLETVSLDEAFFDLSDHGAAAADVAATIKRDVQTETELTCSVGVATHPQVGRDWDTLFKATDEALYASKRNGRNRVTVWTPRIAGAAA